MSFEKGLKRLEALVAKLEGGDLGLDAALKAFEEGVRLSRELGARLDEAEKKVELLMTGSNGELESIPLDDHGDTGLPGDEPEEG